eukprot:CAMPEP_0113893446 /NCGR_PEP_ID=MMETSP0780_2-20120614/16090_1 /TAXON_ID=652834 /ORGANISM="Palpitomonas bilix" /LENGTH=355 /DNA_ID=CAMNT_0000883723 /DNA_START=200 /DNA_END=1264 /DNA_ORIENTATION=+ /assembly_acc=CAM_ASM_000599
MKALLISLLLSSLLFLSTTGAFPPPQNTSEGGGGGGGTEESLVGVDVTRVWTAMPADSKSKKSCRVCFHEEMELKGDEWGLKGVLERARTKTGRESNCYYLPAETTFDQYKVKGEGYFSLAFNGCGGLKSNETHPHYPAGTCKAGDTACICHPIYQACHTLIPARVRLGMYNQHSMKPLTAKKEDGEKLVVNRPNSNYLRPSGLSGYAINEEKAVLHYVGGACQNDSTNVTKPWVFSLYTDCGHYRGSKMNVIGKGNPMGVICNDAPGLSDFCTRCFWVVDPLNCASRSIAMMTNERRGGGGGETERRRNSDRPAYVPVARYEQQDYIVVFVIGSMVVVVLLVFAFSRRFAQACA